MIFIKEIIKLSKYWRQLKTQCDTKWFTAFSGKGEFTFQKCSLISVWPSYLGFYVLCFLCRGHRDNSSWRRYNLMWSIRTTIKALRGTDKQRITYSNEASNISRQNSNNKNHSCITPFEVRQCKDCRNSPGLKVYMVRKYGKKVVLQKAVPEWKSRGHELFSSLLILAPCGKIRIPWSRMRNLKIPLLGTGFGFLHLFKAV